MSLTKPSSPQWKSADRTAGGSSAVLLCSNYIRNVVSLIRKRVITSTERSTVLTSINNPSCQNLRKVLLGFFFVLLISSQDLFWDRPSDQKFCEWLLFNHKYVGIGRWFIMLVPISKAVSIFLFVYHSENFQKCSVCAGFDFVSCHLLRKRVCIHSWNVNNKYCIAITPVEQSLHPVVNYA